MILNTNLFTAKSTVISPDLLVWKFCGKTEFPHSFGRIAKLLNQLSAILLHQLLKEELVIVLRPSLFKKTIRYIRFQRTH